MLTRALLAVRGNLPAKPDSVPPVEMGQLHDGEHTLVEKLIGMIKNGGPFLHGNMDALIAMARATDHVTVQPGHVFWKAGDPPSFSIRITYGRVRCTSTEGTQIDVGSSFALGAFDTWSGQPRAYTAEAQSIVQAYRTNLEDFLPGLEGHVDLAMELLKVLAEALLRGGGAAK